ncbi:MAG: LysM peptidoglycan-binding domain-containing protein [Acidobacteria bacterium]|nr:LysM peptidoglycan-binding domain-containing protein [Acidobacteriota bacterium]
MPPQRLLPLALLLLAVTVSCASVSSRSSARPSEPAPGPVATTAPAPADEPSLQATLEDEPRPAPKAGDRIQQLIDSMQELYGTGLEAHKAGRFDEARDYFDRAVESALNADVEIDSSPTLKAAYEEMLENIDSLEGDLYQDGVAKGEEPPKDELKDITSYLSPEEAEKEREKVQSASGAVEYNIPVVLNNKVLTFIEAFQTRMRGPFEAGLRRSGRYLPMINRIFEEEGVPTDLAYMAHQESAFKTSAYSRAKAKGLWQFMSFTGRKYGLKRDQWVDERSDPEKSTRAAARYLRDLYGMFGDWYLAMAAYNAGEGKVGRGMKRTGAKDFWTLAQHRRALRVETKNYVPAILASMIIDKSPQEYGFHVEPVAELFYEQVTLDSATDLKVAADCAGISVEELKELNPELRTMATPPYAEGYSLKVPVGVAGSFMEKYAAVPMNERLRWTPHQVKRGETLSVIGRKYGVSVSAIMAANSMRSSHRLKPGQSLVIPLSGAMPVKISRDQLDEDAPTYDKGEKVIHRVRRGDTLQKIALRYHTTIASLQQWNRISGSSIRPGQRLTAYYRTVAGSTPPEPAEPQLAVSATGEYRVRRGDTLYSISQRFGITVEQLRQVNNLGRSSIIKPGDRLRVVSREETEGSISRPSGPSSSTKIIKYRIRPGDTLEEIASRHRVEVSDLMRWNRLSSADAILAGSTLRVRLN